MIPDKEKIIMNVKEVIDSPSGYLNYLEEPFEFIRYRNITRKSERERLLDTVLEMIPTVDIVDLYMRICSYYHAINRDATMDYAQYYLEMYDDDRCY